MVNLCLDNGVRLISKVSIQWLDTGQYLNDRGAHICNGYEGQNWLFWDRLYSGKIIRTASDSDDWYSWWDKVVYRGKSTIGFHGIAGFEYFLSNNIAFAVEGMYSSVTFPGEWTITEHPDPFWVGELSTEFTEPVQAGGITLGAGIRFYVG